MKSRNATLIDLKSMNCELMCTSFLNLVQFQNCVPGEYKKINFKTASPSLRNASVGHSALPSQYRLGLGYPSHIQEVNSSEVGNSYHMEGHARYGFNHLIGSDMLASPKTNTDKGIQMVMFL